MLIFPLQEVNNAAKNDENSKIDDKTLEALWELGAFCIQVPNEYGGLGLTNTQYGKFISIAIIFKNILICIHFKLAMYRKIVSNSWCQRFGFGHYHWRSSKYRLQGHLALWHTRTKGKIFTQSINRKSLCRICLNRTKLRL